MSVPEDEHKTKAKICSCDPDNVKNKSSYIQHVLKHECDDFMMRCPFSEKYHDLKYGEVCPGIVMNRKEDDTSFHRHISRQCVAKVKCNKCDEVASLHEVYIYIIHAPCQNVSHPQPLCIDYK